MKLCVLLLLCAWVGKGASHQGSLTPISDSNFQQACEAWVSHAASAQETYGEISKWDVSKITSMAGAFQDSIGFDEV